MTLTFAQATAAVAGLAIIATGFIYPRTGRGFLKGMLAAIALAVAAALLIAVVRQFG